MVSLPPTIRIVNEYTSSSHDDNPTTTGDTIRLPVREVLLNSMTSLLMIVVRRQQGNYYYLLQFHIFEILRVKLLLIPFG